MVVRMIIVAMTGLSLTAASLPARAADNGSSAQNGAQRPTNAKGEPLICKRFQRSESRLKSMKLCYTAEEWKKLNKELES